MALRRVFLVAIGAIIMVIANLAPGAASIGLPGDKLNHALAFAVLTPLAAWAFPRTRVLVLFAALMLFNAGIEVCQAVLNLGREPDIADWGVGVLATLPFLTLLTFYRLVRVER